MTLCAKCGVGVPCFDHDSPAGPHFNPMPEPRKATDHEWWCAEGDDCECFDQHGDLTILEGK